MSFSPSNFENTNTSNIHHQPCIFTQKKPLIFHSPPRKRKKQNLAFTPNNTTHKKNIQNPSIFSVPPSKNIHNNKLPFSRKPKQRNIMSNEIFLTPPNKSYSLKKIPFSSPLATKYSQKLTPQRKRTLDFLQTPPSKNNRDSPMTLTFHRTSPGRDILKNLRKRINSYNTPPVKNKKYDRFLPSLSSNANGFDIHSPYKRFKYGSDITAGDKSCMISAINLKKAKKNGSSTHQLKQRLAQHTYNKILQCELLGTCDETNDFLGEDDMNMDGKNDNMDIDQQMQFSIFNGKEDMNECNVGDKNINDVVFDIMSPARVPAKSCTPPTNKKVDKKHHHLCPAFNLGNICQCSSITGNTVVNFLTSPHRTLCYTNGSGKKVGKNVGNDVGNENEFLDNFDVDINKTNNENLNIFMSPIISNGITPLNLQSQKYLLAKKKHVRNIAKSPFKVLDAPRLTDDFYLNLVDWSASCNVLAVGLNECVYLWSACTSKVSKLCDLSSIFQSMNIEVYTGANNISNDGQQLVCSVAWSVNTPSSSIFDSNLIFNRRRSLKNDSISDMLAIGSGSGHVFIYDTTVDKLVCGGPNISKHHHRVSVISWRNNNEFVSGSRDRNIWLRDIRIPGTEGEVNPGKDVVSKLLFHKQEVCGLKWSTNGMYLASGGNDNKLCVWDIRNCKQPMCYGKHRAAVKAIAWSPHNSNILVSGGGTADRCIKFWNIHSFVNGGDGGFSSRLPLEQQSLNAESPVLLKPFQNIDTGSQVCNLLWSTNVNEIVSTHGYSLNQIVVWKYPSMDKIVTLTGHTYRVLYLAGSPDGQSIVTGAGDETLRLWNVFPPTDKRDVESFAKSMFFSPLLIR